MAPRSPASASPTKSQFFFPMAVGRMAFSTRLLSISTRRLAERFPRSATGLFELILSWFVDDCRWKLLVCPSASICIHLWLRFCFRAVFRVRSSGFSRFQVDPLQIDKDEKIEPRKKWQASNAERRTRNRLKPELRTRNTELRIQYSIPPPLHLTKKKARPKPRCEIAMCECSVVRGSRGGNDVDALAALVELDFAVHEGEQRPIAAGADILPGGKFRAALADEYAAGGDKFPAIAFHAQSFARAVASVADAALTFFVCHKTTV